MDKLLNKKDACELLGISDTTLWRLITRGNLKAYRVGAQVRLSVDDLQHYLDTHGVSYNEHDLKSE